MCSSDPGLRRRSRRCPATRAASLDSGCRAAGAASVYRAISAEVSSPPPAKQPLGESEQKLQEQTSPAYSFAALSRACVACDLAAILFSTGSSLASGMSSGLAHSGLGALIGAGLMILWMYRLGRMFLTGESEWKKILEEGAALFIAAAILASGAYGLFVDLILSPAMSIASGFASAAFNAASSALGSASCSTAGLVGPAVTFAQLQNLICILSSLHKIVVAGLIMGLTIATHISLLSLFIPSEVVQILSGLAMLFFFAIIMAIFIFAAVEITWDLVIGAATFPLALAAWPFPLARRAGAHGLRLLAHGLVHLVLIAIGTAIAGQIMGFALTSYLASAAKGGGGFQTFAVTPQNFDAAFSALQNSSRGLLTVADVGFWWAAGAGVVIWMALTHSRAAAGSIAAVAGAGLAATARAIGRAAATFLPVSRP